jgi:hypothetical protein
MNERLRAVLDRAKKLPDADQEALARLIEEELEEREWAALSQRLGARAFHDQLREELREAEERGELDDQQWEVSPAVRAAIEKARAEVAPGDYVSLDELDHIRRGQA